MHFVTLLLLVGGAFALPPVANILAKRDVAQPGCTTSQLCNTNVDVSDAEAGIPAEPNAATELSAARTNCGMLGICDTFDPAEQYISTTGEHEFVAPETSQIRGPCPGLNTLANNNYIPRSGVSTVKQAVPGLMEAYGMDEDLAAFLAFFAVITQGDLKTSTFSIGGPLPASSSKGTESAPEGISYSHNEFEGDTSLSRCDAYTNDGDAHSSSPTRFGYAYEYLGADNDLTLDEFGQLIAQNTVRSINQNPYYFAPFVSTTINSPLSYNFAINFFSNHSAAQPGGYLNGDIFKMFFSYTGEYPNLVWTPGNERIPDNWYKRPTNNPYGPNNAFADLISTFNAYPDAFRFGGNINGVQTYQAVDIASFTGGAYNQDTLFDGNNTACLTALYLVQITPLQLQNGPNNATEVDDLLHKYLDPYMKSMNCPKNVQLDASSLQPYPGRVYQPTAPSTGPQDC